MRDVATVYADLDESPPGVTVAWLMVERRKELAAMVVIDSGYDVGMSVSKLSGLFRELHRLHGVKRFVLAAPAGWAELARRSLNDLDGLLIVETH